MNTTVALYERGAEIGHGDWARSMNGPLLTVSLAVVVVLSATGCKEPKLPQRPGLKCGPADTEFVSVAGGGTLQKRAVTAADFECCAVAGRCSVESFADARQRGCTIGDPRKEEHPANCVDFDGAAQYCKSIGATLPTAALWLRAVGGTRQTYPWGDAPVRNKANCDQGVCGDRFAMTAPVTAFADSAGPNGAVQLAGNVFAWLDDWYESPANTAPELAVTKRTYRQLRGGSWREHEHAMRNDAVHYKRPKERLSNIGFRCARP